MLGQGTPYFLAIFLLKDDKSSEVLTPLLNKSFIIFSDALGMDKDYALYLLNKTKKDYNLISKDFSNTRNLVWPETRILEKHAKDGDRILDLGCGNGRLVELFKGKRIEYSGVDGAEKLIEIAKERYPEFDFQAADVLNLPFGPDNFDKIFSIAVLHHIPSRELRGQFIREAKRVLKPGGTLIITAWDLWGSFGSVMRILKFFFRKTFGKSRLDFKDVFVPWQGKISRYVHCFTKGELKKLAKEEGLKIKETGFLKREGSKNRNIYLVAEKV